MWWEQRFLLMAARVFVLFCFISDNWGNETATESELEQSQVTMNEPGP